MTPADLDRVFGRGRLQMATGDHVEVFRDDTPPGEPRRFTKRFLETAAGDFRPWTEREWRILQHLGRNADAPIAKVASFVDFDFDGAPVLQTVDAGVTVDQWACLVPLKRGGVRLRNAMEDCAHWWALARQCLVALDALHALGFVHLDVKADNVCIPWAPASASRVVVGEPLAPQFERLAFIDVAFSILPGIDIDEPLPLARQPDYEYQSPRLIDALDEGRRGRLRATRELDWRCDLFSLAAMLWRYLPELDDAAGAGWTPQRHSMASAFVRLLLDAHSGAGSAHRPHRELIAIATLRLREPQLAADLQAPCFLDAGRVLRAAERVPRTRVVRPLLQGGPADAEAEPGPAAARAVERTPMGSQASAPPPLDPDMTAPMGLPAVSAASAASAAWPSEPALAKVDADGAIGSEPGTPPDSTVRPDARAPFEPTAMPEPTDRYEPPRPKRSVEPRRTEPVVGLDTAGPDGSAALDDAGGYASGPGRLEPAAEQADSSSLPEGRDRSGAEESAPGPWNRSPRESRRRRPVLQALALLVVGLLALGAAAWWLLIRPASLDGRGAWVGAGPASAVVAQAEPASAPDVVARAQLPAPSSPGAEPAPAAGATSTAPSGAASAAPSGDPERAASAPGSSAAGPVASAPSRAGDSAATEPAPADAVAPTPPPGNASAPAPAGAAAPATAAIAEGAEFEPVAAALMRDRLPRIAQNAERQLGRVLTLAGDARELSRRGAVRSAAQAARAATPSPVLDVPVNAKAARALNEQALVAYWRENDVPEALALQRRAFGANPLDPEVVGNLAFLRLKEQPPQPEASRQLALHALTVKDPRFPTGRIEDWTSFAIASALTGREADARNAWFVSMALASDLQRQCNAAVRAQAIYGDKLRPSVQAMLQRARSSAAYGRCDTQEASDGNASPGARSKPRQGLTRSEQARRERRTIP